MYYGNDVDGYKALFSWFVPYPGAGDEGEAGGGSPAPLSAKEREKLRKAIEKNNKRLQKEKCAKFMRDHDINPSDLSDSMAQHQAFSGPRSTEISTRDAGLYSPEELKRLDALIQQGGQAADAARYELSRSVAQYFKDGDGSRDGRRTGAVVANYNGNPNTAFYRSFDAVKILHETLHIVTGQDDKALAERLGAGKFNDSKLASAAITNVLKANGCG